MQSPQTIRWARNKEYYEACVSNSTHCVQIKTIAPCSTSQRQVAENIYKIASFKERATKYRVRLWLVCDKNIELLGVGHTLKNSIRKLQN